jgi:hypothetical protein
MAKIDLFQNIGLLKNKRLKNMIREGDFKGIQKWFAEILFFPSYPADLLVLRNCILLSFEYVIHLDKHTLYDLVQMMQIASSKINQFLYLYENGDLSLELITYFQTHRGTFIYLCSFFENIIESIVSSDTIEGRFISTMLEKIVFTQNISKDRFFIQDHVFAESHRIHRKIDDFTFVLLDIIHHTPC